MITVERGSFQLWRKIIDSPVWKHEGLLKVWIWCLTQASNEDQFVEVNIGRGRKTTRKLEPGQFIFSRAIAAEQLGMPPSTIRNHIETLVSMKQLDKSGQAKQDKRATTLTVSNWKTYNLSSTGNGQARTSEPGQARTSENGSDSKEKEKPAKPNADELFERFWAAFPRGRKKSKGDARKAFLKAMIGNDVEMIIRRAAEYAESEEGKGAYVKMPSTWLNQRCWEDDDFAWTEKVAQAKSRPLLGILPDF